MSVKRLISEGIPMGMSLFSYIAVFTLGVSAGFLMALPLLYATVRLVWGGEPIVNLVFPLNPTMVGHIIFEEIVWRVFPCYLMISESLPPIRCVFLAVVLSLLFVFGHKLHSVRDFIERFCFTTLLYISAMMWPGFNFGLHLGRNAWTAGSSDKNEEI